MAFGLSIKIGADVSDLDRKLRSASQRFAGFESGIKSSIATVSRFTTAIASLAGIAGFGALIKSSIDTGDKIQKLAIRLNASTEAISQYAYVANLAGVDIEALGKAWQRQSANIGDAVRGTGEAKQAIEDLGLDLKKLAALKPEDQFEAIAAQLGKVNDSAKRLSIAEDIWGGRGAAAALQIMDGGIEKIRELRSEADRLGLTLNREQADRMAAINDSITNMKSSLQGLANTIAIIAGPAVTEFFNTLSVGLPTLKDAFPYSVSKMKIPLMELGAWFFETSAAFDEWKAKFMFGDWVDQTMESAKRNQKRATEIRLAIAEEAGKIVQITQDLENRRTFTVKPGKGLDAISGEVDIKTGETTDKKKSAEDMFKEYKRYFDDIRKVRMDAFSEYQAGLMSEEEALAASYARRAEMILQSQEAGLISEEEANNRLIVEQNRLYNELAIVKQKGLTDLERFNAMSWKQQAETVFGEMENITAGVAQHNKALFRINQLAGISNAVISAHEGIAKTMSKYPYPISIGMAALQAAAAFAQVNAIRRASYGGSGGTAPSLAGSTAAPATTNVGTTHSLYVEGINPSSLFTGATVRDLAQRLIDYQKDGGKVVLVSQ